MMMMMIRQWSWYFQVAKLKKDLKRTKALLKDAQMMIEKSQNEGTNKVIMRQLKNQVGGKTQQMHIFQTIEHFFQTNLTLRQIWTLCQEVISHVLVWGNKAFHEISSKWDFNINRILSQLEDAEFARTAAMKARQNAELELADVQVPHHCHQHHQHQHHLPLLLLDLFWWVNI